MHKRFGSCLVYVFVVASMTSCEEDKDVGPGAVPPAGLAVLSGDYKSVAVSLIDPAQGTLVRDECITSGTVAPQLSNALSGDVTLASQPQPGNELVLIDRTNATLTWVDPKTCGVLRQLNVGVGFKGNPHDIVAVTATKAYVTRYGTNPAKDAEGSDLLVIDPSTATIIKSIDLRAQATLVADKAILPAPDRAVLVGGKVYVSLNNLSADYKAAGHGRVVIIDPALDAVVGTIDLPSLKNCGALTAVSAPAGLLVSCGGVFADGAQQINTAGMAWIDLSTTPPTTKIVASSAFGRVISGLTVAGGGPSLGFAITNGEFTGPPPDAVWMFDFVGGTPRKIFEGGGSFTLAGLIYDPARKKLFVSDANDAAPKLQVFDLSDATAPKLQTAVVTNGAGLPPREATFY